MTRSAGRSPIAATIAFHQRNEPLHQAPIAVRDFAPEQIHRLYAIRALVDLRDARVADELLHPVLADVAVAAEALQREVRDLEADVGTERLDDGRHECHEVRRFLSSRRVRMAFLGVDEHADPVGERAHALDVRLHRHQHAAHVGMHDDRVGLGVRCDGAPGRSALQALPRVGDGVLVADFRETEALHPDAEPRTVHHGEHCAHALVRLADQPATRVLEVHDACRVRLDAHLVLDRSARHPVRRSGRALVRRQPLRHQEQTDALRPRRRVRQPSEHEVDDVVGEIVLAGRDEDLRPGHEVGAVAGWSGARADHAEVRSGVWLGETHGACPRAVHQLRKETGLELVVAPLLERTDGPVREQRVHAEGQVG